MTTKKLFLEDAYLQETEAKVLGVNDRGGVILDRSIFYATSGGQPGDSGSLTSSDGTSIAIATTVTGDDKDEIVLVPEEDAKSLVGQLVTTRINWDRRHKLMRMHSALHLLCASLPFPVTGGQIGEAEGRLDFSMPENPDKEALSIKLNSLVEMDHQIASRWIDDAELESNMDLIRTMSVKPPMGTGKVRLVSIGNDEIDLQPCGGTHVRSTGEIGPLVVGKIENKGKQNRRVRLKFA